MKRRIHVKEIMRDSYLMIEGVATVSEALADLQRDNARALIVNKRDDNDEYGIVLLSDISKKVLAADRHPERVNVYEIMSKPVITVSANMDVRYCSRLFNQFGLSCAPVVDDNGEIIGIVDYTSLILKGLAELY